MNYKPFYTDFFTVCFFALAGMYMCVCVCRFAFYYRRLWLTKILFESFKLNCLTFVQREAHGIDTAMDKYNWNYASREGSG